MQLKGSYLKTAAGVVKVVDSVGMYLLCEGARNRFKYVFHYELDGPIPTTRADFYNDRAGGLLEWLDSQGSVGLSNMVRHAKVGRSNIDAVDFLVADGNGLFPPTDVKNLREWVKMAFLTFGM